ncbi:MAG: Asp23/Gls24 family envelope stress response protein [Clostridiales bacterium]|nr:Asp23/Gls24 family envelope stress response protein [Clostridiales bacterium]
MIKIKNHIGEVTISSQYLKNLIGKNAMDCFGVVGMNSFGPKQGLRSLLKSSSMDNGVIIRQKNNKLLIDLHISVTYGVNMNAISESIVNKVRYAVESEAGIKVLKVNVFIDNMQ